MDEIYKENQKLRQALAAIFQSNDIAFKQWMKNHTACKRCHTDWPKNKWPRPTCICGPQPCRACGSLTADIVNDDDKVLNICVNCSAFGIKELFAELCVKVE